MFGLIVNVLAAEPSHGNDMDDAGHGPNLVAVVDRQEVGERDFVARHDAERGIRGSLIDIETAPNAQHDAEQKQGERDAGDSQEAAALVAEGGLGDETGEGHGADEDILPRGKSGQRVEVRGQKSISDFSPTTE